MPARARRAVIAGGDTAISLAADAITRAAAEVRVIEAGIRGLREQRAAALAIDLRRQAETLRKQADEKRKEQADLVTRSRKRLDGLGRIEQLVFESLPPTAGLLRSLALLEEAAAAEREAAASTPKDSPPSAKPAPQHSPICSAPSRRKATACSIPNSPPSRTARGCDASLQRIAPTLMNAPRNVSPPLAPCRHRHRRVLALGAPALLPPDRRGDLFEPAA